MKASICMAAFQRPALLRRTLESIYRQTVPFEFEVIVCDDGGGLPQELFADFQQVQWHKIERVPTYRNPACARNVTYRAARGEVLICQSEEVVHISDNCIERLVLDLKPRQCLFAKVLAVDSTGVACGPRMGIDKHGPRPFFFLGSMWRSDMYAVGGNDEEFTAPGLEDKWLGHCLLKGLWLTPVYSETILGHHQYHLPVPNCYGNRRLYNRKKHVAERSGQWQNAGGSWSMDTEPGSAKKHGFDVIFPQFKYQWHYHETLPNTSIVSNIHDLSGFSIP